MASNFVDDIEDYSEDSESGFMHRAYRKSYMGFSKNPLLDP